MARFWLTPDLAQRLLAAMETDEAEVRCSLDLGLSSLTVRISAGMASFGEDAALSAEQVRRVAGSKRGVFLLEADRLEPVQVSGTSFYKLIPTDEAPTIEIDGIQMHRTTGTHPFENATRSARTVVRPGARVLDTCGGLGYTAIAAARLGAAAVVSVEVDANVRAIARKNPWSAEYFGNPVIELADGDAAGFVSAQPDAAFDRVIHDPPRFSRAGELYGAGFYAELARVLRRGGRMFHYTGEPYSRGRGRAFVPGVMKRLRAAGFEVKRAEQLQGVVARRGPAPGGRHM